MQAHEKQCLFQNSRNIFLTLLSFCNVTERDVIHSVRFVIHDVLKRCYNQNLDTSRHLQTSPKLFVRNIT